MTEPTFASMLQHFFLNRLIKQKNVSPHTISSYRDTFRLLLEYLSKKINKPPSSFTIEDLDVHAILDFLDYIETNRGNTPSSRNVRLAAIRSFFSTCGYFIPESLDTIQRVLSIPTKKTEGREINFLTVEEIQAIINAPQISTWSGLRDHTMFTTFYNTGARVSEITNLKFMDLSLSTPSIKIHGKGRKDRIIPLWKNTKDLIGNWLKHIQNLPENPIFPNARGCQMTRHGVGYRLKIAKKEAEKNCPSLKGKQISPHSIRHTTAMHLLQSGIDITVIAIWLGHESPTTTNHYLQADLAMKKKILEQLAPPHTNSVLFQPDDSLLKFLENL